MKAKNVRRLPRFSRLALYIRAALYGEHHARVERMVMHNFLLDTSRK